MLPKPFLLLFLKMYIDSINIFVCKLFAKVLGKKIVIV